MKKVTMGALLIVVVVLLFSSCTSTVALEEFETYRMANQSKLEQLEAEVAGLKQKQAEYVPSAVFAQELQGISERVVVLENTVATIEGSLDRYAKDEEVARIKADVDTLVRDFNGVYRSLDELVRMAGYDSSEDFLQLGRDIVNVNLNIKALEKKLEQLRTAMALFVNQ
ncbi:MAG TPA: hypothetical protein DIW48_07795 [Sphaerochaeta sp.]|nr:MAG: hypothetical protein A2Y31_07535 [Spirochaetes bacterium GWC2_52_13]HCG63634.1 hypothetical protein [Sphaerochaeta sp.]HCS36571.1 hypothetical protein [Sphaerochaeta sp.]